MNLRQELVEFELATGERLEMVAVGRRRGHYDFDHDVVVEPMARDEALALVDYDFDGGMGSRRRPHALFGWTRSWCVFLGGEEGATVVTWLPRDPRRCVPEHGGNWWMGGPHDWRELARRD